MNLKALKGLSILGLASLTLVACGSEPKSISCDGLNFFGPLSYTTDEETIVIKLDGREFSTNFADKSEVTVEVSKVII